MPPILEDAGNGLPALAREMFGELYAQFLEKERRVANHDRLLQRLALASAVATRLMEVSGVGPPTASALVASVGDA